jgi:hypothetical protein
VATVALTGTLKQFRIRHTASALTRISRAAKNTTVQTDCHITTPPPGSQSSSRRGSGVISISPPRGARDCYEKWQGAIWDGDGSGNRPSVISLVRRVQPIRHIPEHHGVRQRWFRKASPKASTSGLDGGPKLFGQAK